MTLTVQVTGIGIAGPGLTDWAQAAPVLAGAQVYAGTPLVSVPPAMLPANERRRAGASVRLALRVAEEACRAGACDPGTTAGVFASSTGDAEIAHQMLESLADPAPVISPTRFHNSVHNAAAGYWSIATGSRQTATSVGAGDGSFATGLLLAAVQVAGDGQPVLLVAYDLPFPEPLCESRPIAAPFATALLLTPPQARGTALRLALRPGADDAESSLGNGELEQLRRGNPAARALPLLSALAAGGAARVSLPVSGEGRLEVEVMGAG